MLSTINALHLPLVLRLFHLVLPRERLRHDRRRRLRLRRAEHPPSSAAAVPRVLHSRRATHPHQHPAATRSPHADTLTSTPKGSPLIPGVFVIVGDVVAVKGGGGRKVWRALRMRYDASPIFQSLLWQMNWFWGSGSLATTVVTTLFIYLMRNLDVVFALGKSLATPRKARRR